MKSSVSIGLALSLVAAMTCGCISEERGMCYNTICLTYTGDGDTELFNEKIDRLDLYIFDENHRCILIRALTPRELAERKAQVELQPGRTYSAVCVGNAVDDVTMNLYEGMIADTRLYHRGTMDGQNARVGSHDHLYQGGAELAIPPGGIATDTVRMNSSHVEMIVEVEGYSEPGPGSRAETDDTETAPGLEHKNLPAWTDFTNTHSKRRPGGRDRDIMSQFPVAEEAEDKYLFTYNVMRDLSGTMLHLYDSGGNEIVMPGLPVDVEAYIAEYLVPDSDIAGPYGADGELLQEAVVPIGIEFVNATVVVSIPDWAVTPTTPEF